MAAPTVSICIPVYNGAATIEEAINSVLAQTFSDFDIIVVDNCSTDDTVSIVKGINDARVSVQVNDENYGPVENWNRAVLATTGKYVKLLCADDALAPTCLQRQVDVLEAPGNEQIVLTAVRRTVVDDNGNVLMQGRGLGGMKGRVSGHDVIRKTVRSGTNPLGEPAAVLIRGDLLRQNMPWDGSLGYMIDVDMWTRVLAHGDLYAIPESLATFRVSTGAWSGELAGKQRKQATEFMKRLQERYPHLISATDVKIGAAQAALLAQGRRATYWYSDRKK
jgi:glycosyltransferase involved in cell wall biosynthesis